MGERGVVTRILASKYGGFLTFGALGAGRESAPGQPTVAALKALYRSHSQSADTRVFGIIGNPVGHSRSPLLHNTAMGAAGWDGVYVPLLVDDLDSFAATFRDADWAGFSVTIPHKARGPLLRAVLHAGRATAERRARVGSRVPAERGRRGRGADRRGQHARAPRGRRPGRPQHRLGGRHLRGRGWPGRRRRARGLRVAARGAHRGRAGHWRRGACARVRRRTTRRSGRHRRQVRRGSSRAYGGALG